MRSLITASVFLVAGLMTSAADEPGSSSRNPATRTICVDVSGQAETAVCHAPASRLDRSEDICVCRSAQRVEAPVCRSGEKPPPENRAYDKARKLAAADGSLVGDLFNGAPMCIEPRNTYR